MSTSYPQAIDQFTPKVDGVDTVSAAHFNNLQDAIQQVETTLGTNPAVGFTSVAASLSARLPKSGGTMTGNLNMGGNRLRNLAAPQEGSDGVNRSFVESAVSPEGIRWRDDFLGGRSSRWTLSGTGGTCLQNAEVGGTADLSTGDTSGNAAQLSFAGQGCTSRAQSPSLKVRAKLDATTQVLAVLAGLYGDPDNLVEILYDATTSAGNFRYRCVSGGTETLVDSGKAADTAYHLFALRLDGAAGTGTFSIDGASIQTLSTHVPTSVLEPRLGIQTREAVDKRLTVDLVHLESGR